jgi:hypothetical protein
MHPRAEPNRQEVSHGCLDQGLDHGMGILGDAPESRRVRRLERFQDTERDTVRRIWPDLLRGELV